MSQYLTIPWEQCGIKERHCQNLDKTWLKKLCFQPFYKDSNIIHLFVLWDKLFQILRAFNDNAVPTKEYDGRDVFKEILADDRKALASLCTSIRSLIHDGEKQCKQFQN